MDHSTNQSPGTPPTPSGGVRSRKRPRSDSSGSATVEYDTEYSIYKGDLKLVRGRQHSSSAVTFQHWIQYQGFCRYSNIRLMLDGLMAVLASEERFVVGDPMIANWDMQHEWVSFKKENSWQVYNMIAELRGDFDDALDALKTKTVPCDNHEIYIILEVGLGKEKESREQKLEKELREKDQKITRMRENMIKLAEERQSMEVLAAQHKMDGVRAKLDM